MPALGLAYYRVRSGVPGSGDRKTGGSGEVRVSAFDIQNFGVSLVQTLEKHVVIGSTLRLVNGQGQTGFDLDVASMASFGDVRVGAVARNVRESVGSEREVRIGAALVPRALPSGVLGPFSIDVDVDARRTTGVDGDQRLAAVGSEQWWVNGAFGTRFGVNWNTVGASRPLGAAGLTVKLPHSVFAEGHVTKERIGDGTLWGIGARVTF
jgi:hypothetical protein